MPHLALSIWALSQLPSEAPHTMQRCLVHLGNRSRLPLIPINLAEHCHGRSPWLAWILRQLQIGPACAAKIGP
jgi:hypothetical protein